MDRYKRRDGLKWNSELYKKCLQYLKSNKINISLLVSNETTNRDIFNLTEFIYPTNNSKKRREGVLYFIDCYSQFIIQDIESSNIENIIAPELKFWYEYKSKLIVAMSNIDIRKEVNQYINDSEYKFLPSVRRVILKSIYTSEPYTEYMEQKLKNALFFNKIEICDGLAKSLYVSTANDFEEENDFYGFNSNDISLVKNSFKSINNILNKLNVTVDKEISVTKNVLCSDIKRCYVRLNNLDNLFNENIKKPVSNSNVAQENVDVFNMNEIASENIAYNNITQSQNDIFNMIDNNSNNIKSNKRIKSLKKKKLEPGKFCDKLNKSAIQIFQLEDDNEQLSIFRKLIILHFLNISKDLYFYMNCGSIVPFKYKNNILQIIFTNNVTTYQNALMDLLIPHRYLIRQRVEELYLLFENNNINLVNAFNGCCFEDNEHIFYKLLDRIKIGINEFRRDTVNIIGSNNLMYLTCSNDFNKDRLGFYPHGRAEELSIVDDLATFLVVDLHHFDFISHKINKTIINKLIDNEEFKEKVKLEIQMYTYQNMNTNTAALKLTKLIEKYLTDLKFNPKKLINQIKLYLNVIKIDSGLEFKFCNRYSKEDHVGIKVCATKIWQKGSILDALNGYKENLTNKEMRYLTENNLNFSTTFNPYIKKNQLWLGPGAYVNHDCDSNTKFYCLKNNNEICLETIKTINIGEEITTFYGENYFEYGSCECVTCEKINK